MYYNYLASTTFKDLPKEGEKQTIYKILSMHGWSTRHVMSKILIPWYLVKNSYHAAMSQVILGLTGVVRERND